jgi:hypothetical protein
MNCRLKLNFIGIVVLGVIIALVFPLTAFGQGRGRGLGRGLGLGKKCGKFVNCHDASEGRWDGRGPNRNGIFRNGIFIPYRHRHSRAYIANRGRGRWLP